MSILAVEDWPARLRGRIYQQFKSANWAVPLANVLGKQAADFQLSALAMMLLWSIDPVTDDASSPLYGVGRGVQLDRIGRLVGQARASSDDAHYRLYLRARIRANRSNGTGDAIIAVFQAMFEPLTASQQPLFSLGGQDCIELRLLNPITDLEAEVARLFLGYANKAGRRGILESQGALNDEMFTIPTCCYATGSIAIGDSNNDVTSVAAWPMSGTVIIDAGTSLEEELDFDSRTNDSLHWVGGGPVNAHDPGAAITLQGTVGKAFPLATYLTADAAIAAVSLAVGSSASFAVNDSIIIDGGTAAEELRVVTSTGAGTLGVAALAQAHSTGASVVIVGSGGILARAHQA